MKTILEMAEKTLCMILSVSSCMGLFLIGVFAGNLLYGDVSTDAMWLIFLGGAVLTFLLTRLWEVVRYYRLSIMAEELQEQDEEAQNLYEHLTANL